MLTVHKYQFAGVDSRDALRGEPCDVLMPLDARVVHFGLQHGVPCLWAEVDPDAASGARRFAIRATGAPVEGQHVATHVGGLHVWHLYELPRDEWRKWAGGDEPPADAIDRTVEVVLRDERMLCGPASAYLWRHKTGPYEGLSDIIAYRVRPN